MLRCLATWVLTAPLAFSAIVYQNTNLEAIQDVFADTPGLLAIGDQLELGPGGRSLNRIDTRVATYDDSVTADLRLTIYAVGAGDTVGAILGTSVLAGVTLAPSTSTVVQFGGWSLTLPEQIVVMLSLENASSPAVGLEVAGTPAIGFSDSGFSWWRDSGGFFRQEFPDIPNNYYFVVDASDVTAQLPEPSALWLTAAGFGLLWIRRGRS